MKTKQLDKLFYSISYYIHTDAEVINELNNKDLDFETVYFEGFSKEINRNLLKNLSKENKIDIIKFYLFKFKELTSFFRYSDENLLGETPFFMDTLNSRDNYTVTCHYLYDFALGEIQYCCGKYNIDFWLICEEINFDCELFDNGMTKYFSDLEKNNTDQKNQSNTNQKHQHIFANNGFEMFSYILKEFVKPKNIRGRFSDIAFYYHKMYEDKYIIGKQTAFTEWLNDEYEIEIGKIKALDTVFNPDRLKHYTHTLDKFKHQNL